MGMGLLGALLRVRERQRCTSRFTKPTARRGRPFLESLETRALLSILSANPGLTNTAELAVSGLADDTSLTTVRNHSGDQLPGQDDGPGQNDGSGQNDGPGDNQGGKKNPPVQVPADTQIDVQPGQPDLQLLPSGNGFGDKPRGPDDGGRTSTQSDNSGNQNGNQGGGPSGQGGSSNSSQDDGQGRTPRPIPAVARRIARTTRPRTVGPTVKAMIRKLRLSQARTRA